MNRKLIAIVPAAGVGARAGTDRPKQYHCIRGEPMLRRAVMALLADPRIDQIRVAVAPDDALAAQALQGLPRTVRRPCGGSTRALTVAGALADAALADDAWVLVHDAARPGLPSDALERLISTCLATGQGGLLALPVADTVKREFRRTDGAPDDASVKVRNPVNPHGVAASLDRPCVQESVARDGLWLAQTPQMFPAGLLRRALEHAIGESHSTTDEASAVELMGYRPLLIPGSLRNFKVTWPEDIELMDKWL